MKTVVLDTIHRHIEALLDGAITSVNPTFVASYSDVTSSGFTEGVNVGSLNGVTAVDVVGVPAASTRRLVSEIDIFNADTAPVTLTVRYNDNGTTYKIVTVTLAVGAHWVMSEGTGFYTPPATTAINDFQVGNGSGNWITKTLAQVKTILGLGTAAFLNVGTTASLVVQLDGSAKLPAVDGSQLTGISGGSPSVCNGRLTLTTLTPVTTADVTAAGTLYFTPYVGSKIGLYNGATWDVIAFAEVSLALTLTSGGVYDVFGYNNAGTLTLEVLAWTSGTARATALVRQDGILCKTGALTRRYLGTLVASGTNTTESSASKRYLWNMYNRVSMPMFCVDPTDTWNYSTAAWQAANASVAYGVARVGFVLGLAEDEVRATNYSACSNSTSGYVNVAGGIGLDAVNANAAQIKGGFNCNNTLTGVGVAIYNGVPAIGLHYLSRLEYGSQPTTQSWFGDAGMVYWQTGMVASVMA